MGMDREFQHYISGQSAVVSHAHAGLFRIRIWKEDDLCCDIITTDDHVDMLLDGFYEVDEDLEQFDLGGSD